MPINRTSDDDEGPSAEDLRRFGSETAFCPDCGAEIWDQADVCPKCYAYLGGDTLRRRRGKREWRKFVILMVLIAIVMSFTGFAVYARLFFGR